MAALVLALVALLIISGLVTGQAGDYENFLIDAIRGSQPNG